MEATSATNHLRALPNGAAKCTFKIWIVSYVAFSIIGLLVLQGQLSNVAAGGLAIGLGALPNILHLITIKVRKENLHPAVITTLTITTLVWSILGSLSIAGAVPCSIMGWSMIASTVLGGSLFGSTLYCDHSKR